MRKSSTHFPLLLALTLATGCSPIAHINFPDGSDHGQTGDAGAVMSAPSVVSNFMPLSRTSGPNSHGPVPRGAPGIQSGSGMPMCPDTLISPAIVDFKYADLCSKGSSIHQVSCKYNLGALPSGVSREHRLVSLRYFETATLPYVIHSPSTGTEFNTIQATGTLRVTFTDPNARDGRMDMRMVSLTRPDPGVLPSVTATAVSDPAEVVQRNSVINFPEGTTVGSVNEIIFSATVHCAVHKEVEINNKPYVLAEPANLLLNDKIPPFSWKVSQFAIDVLAN